MLLNTLKVAASRCLSGRKLYMHHVVSSGTLHERMCRKILNAHVFKMAGKITRFLSSKSGKNHKTKNHPTISSHLPKKFAATRQLLALRSALHAPNGLDSQTACKFYTHFKKECRHRERSKLKYACINLHAQR